VSPDDARIRLPLISRETGNDRSEILKINAPADGITPPLAYNPSIPAPVIRQDLAELGALVVERMVERAR
jgi:hypothetical protein